VKYYEMQDIWPEVTQFDEVKEEFFVWLERVTGEPRNVIFWAEYEAENSILEWRWYLKNEEGNFYVDPDEDSQPAQDRSRQEVGRPPDNVLDQWGEILTLIKGEGCFEKSG